MAIHMISTLKIHGGVNPKAMTVPGAIRDDRQPATVTLRLPSKGQGYRTAQGLYFDHRGGGG